MNALHKLKFCDTVHDLNGSLPADLLHTYQLGIYIYAVEGLFGKKKASGIKKKEVRERNKRRREAI
jgi:hypothetical protein